MRNKIWLIFLLGNVDLFLCSVNDANIIVLKTSYSGLALAMIIWTHTLLTNLIWLC